MMTYNSSFDGVNLHSEVTYEFDGKKDVLIRDFVVVDPAIADYWACFDGEAKAFKGKNATCIAALQDALQGLEKKNIYAIFAYKDKSAWNRWTKKWMRITNGGLK